MIRLRNIIIPTTTKCFFNLTLHPKLNSFTKIFSLGQKHIPIPEDVSDKTIAAAFYRTKHSSLWQLYHNSYKLPNLDMNATNDEDTTNIYYHKKAPKRLKECKRIASNHIVHDHLAMFYEGVESYININRPKPKRSKDIKLLQSIIDNYPDVIFKPADKNLGLAAMNILDYDKLVMDHLGDTKNYKCTVSHPLQMKKFLKSINDKYENLIGPEAPFHFTKTELNFIKKWSEFNVPNFYIMPKLHKFGPIKGRPIAGSTNWYTTPISIILEQRLRPHMAEFDSILKNSEQLVKDMVIFNNFYEGPKPLLISGDVEALYPSIDIDDLLFEIEQVDPSLVPLAAFVLKNNYVMYNQQVFHQLNGIAMGTNSAVSLANFYMGRKIDPIFSTFENVIYYKRYIDDIQLFWIGSRTEWNDVSDTVKGIHPSIKITFTDPSPISCDFLDITLSFNPFTDKLDTSIFQKPLNKFQYITPKSTHEPHTLSGFIKGELTRYSRLCNNNYSYILVKHLFKSRLLQRGYSHAFLSKIFNRHYWYHRELPQNITSNQPVIPFVIPYTFRTNQSKLKQAFYKYSNYLSTDFYCKPRFVYSKSRSLLSYLSSSKLSDAQTKELTRLKRLRLQNTTSNKH